MVFERFNKEKSTETIKGIDRVPETKNGFRKIKKKKSTETIKGIDRVPETKNGFRKIKKKKSLETLNELKENTWMHQHLTSKH